MHRKLLKVVVGAGILLAAGLPVEMCIRDRPR